MIVKMIRGKKREKSKQKKGLNKSGVIQWTIMTKK